jgi:Leucine-rich repeat (LRR) protein
MGEEKGRGRGRSLPHPELLVITKVGSAAMREMGNRVQAVYKLTGLSWLSLAHNNKLALSRQLSQLKQLHFLDLRSTGLRDYPPGASPTFFLKLVFFQYFILIPNGHILELLIDNFQLAILHAF